MTPSCCQRFHAFSAGKTDRRRWEGIDVRTNGRRVVEPTESIASRSLCVCMWRSGALQRRDATREHHVVSANSYCLILSTKSVGVARRCGRRPPPPVVWEARIDIEGLKSLTP